MESQSASSQCMTVNDTARHFGVHVETVRRWIRERKLAAKRIRFGCPGYRIERSEVERFERDMIGAPT